MNLTSLWSHTVKLLKSHLIAGILVFIPFGAIAWIVSTVAQALWTLHGFVPAGWIPEETLDAPVLGVLIKLVLIVAATLALALALSFLGWGSKRYLGKKILEWIGEIIQHIPVIRSVYSALDQLLRTMATGSGQQFSRVVYVEYPRKGCWTLAFVTGPARGPAAPENHLNIFVPTTPNPTSGFYLIVPESEVRESGMRVEEAFRNILSLGIAGGSRNS